LTAVLVLATSVWIGGYVAIAVVARAADRTLPPPTRIAFFRSFGRQYAVVGTSALLVALATGGALLSDRSWTGSATAAVVIAAALLVCAVGGMAQARRMTRLRHAAAKHRDDGDLAERVRHGARQATWLRLTIGVLSLALLALGVLLAVPQSP
jgi:uncharacterized membrane protein